MHSNPLRPTVLAFVLGLAAPALLAQESLPGGPPPGSPPRLPDGMTVEEMWPPPTEEDWAKPVLIEFERTWEDALAVAAETQKPICVCINMDGEIASEHYAGVHYRTPETAQLFDDYVCVIASVYRHTPRDHDENGPEDNSGPEGWSLENGLLARCRDGPPRRSCRARAVRKARRM